MKHVSPYAKAVVGALVAGLTAFYQANQDNHLTVNEIVVIVVAVLTALGVVWAVPNATSSTAPEAPVLHTDDAPLIVEDPTL